MKAEEVREQVRAGYAQIAGGGSCCGPAAGCCGASPVASADLAQHIGYTPEELAALPDGANLGLSCGNPNALAALQPGDTVLDLGAGGGFDVFIAGSKVGPTGRAIGVDMTAEMLAKARGNAVAYGERTGWDNVEFRLGEIENLPVADGSVDVVISNCVINLSPDKPRVWREIARVLKPGGRVAVSDLALLRPLPPAIAESVEALIGCVAGAVLVSETERMVRAAGLVDLEVKSKSEYIDGMVGWQDPLYQRILEQLPAGTKPSDFVTSLEISARKSPQSSGAAAALDEGRKPTGTLLVYDPAMCCSTGVCGPEVDPVLVRFAADLKWLQDQGVEVRRFNLGQNPAAFVENEAVKDALTERGEAALPLLFVDGRGVASGTYPNRSRLVDALGLSSTTQPLVTPVVKELVAIGAAIAANCEPCLRYHVRVATEFGASMGDVTSAIEMAAKVKEVPHQSVLKLAARLTLEEDGTVPGEPGRELGGSNAPSTTRSS